MLNFQTTGQLVQAVRTLARIYPHRKAACVYLQPRDDFVAESLDYDEYKALEDRDLEPCCIVGHALFQAGIPISEIRPRNEDQIGSEELNFMLHKLGVKVRPEDIEWLRVVQCAQDEGAAWSQAVRGADHG